MLKKLITYTDYNGRERKEHFYFYLSKAELMEMELSEVGGLRNLLSLIIEKQNVPLIIKELKKFILKSYGEKSSDGVRFIKSEELSTAFSQTEAYSNLYLELISSAEAAAAFINGVVPEDLAKGMDEIENAKAEKETAESEEEKVPEATVDKEGAIHLLGQKG